MQGTEQILLAFTFPTAQSDVTSRDANMIQFSRALRRSQMVELQRLAHKRREIEGSIQGCIAELAQAFSTASQELDVAMGGRAGELVESDRPQGRAGRISPS